MAGRGRGKLAEALARAKEEAAAAAAQPPVPVPTASQPSDVGAPPPPRSLGRGRFLQMAAASVAPKEPIPPAASEATSKSITSVPATETATSTSSDTPRSMGRGRLMSKLLSQSSAASTVSEAPSKTSAGSERAVSEVASSMSAVNISVSAEPVVKMGKCGTEVTVVSNMIRLTFDPEKGVYFYNVSFLPEVDNKNIRFKLLREHISTTRGIRCYDGGSTLYLPNQITDSVQTFACQNPNDDTPVKMIIKFVKKLRIGEATHLLNVLFLNMAKELKMAKVGKSYFNYAAAETIPQYQLAIWPGIVTSVEEKEDGVYLTCDINHKVIRTQTAYDVMQMARHAGDWKAEIEKELIGACVTTHYNNNFYRVDDIDWQKSPDDTFPSRSGEKIRFADYYKNAYNLDISDLGQPMLVSRMPKRAGVKTQKTDEPELILLVPELCRMTGLTDNMRKDFKAMKMIATYTRVTPQQREISLRKFIGTIRANDNCRAMLNEWGLDVPMESVSVTGRILPQTNLQFANNRSVPVKADFGRDVTTNGLFRPVDIRRWAIIYESRDERRAQLLENTLVRIKGAMGGSISKPDMYRLQGRNIPDIVNGIKECVHAGAEALVVIMAQSRDDIYMAVKRITIGDLGVPSQVVLSNTLAREDKVRPIIQKILMQIIAKMGGALWGIRTPLDRLMVCGIDSYHDAGHKSASVGALVASLDPSYTSYYSMAVLQNVGQELLSSLRPSLVEALRTYQRRNGFLPERLIVFRDGVSDGELKNSSEFEVKQIKSACFLLHPDYQPKLIYVIVQKRIQTRMYVRQGNQLDNPTPGTVMDHTLTKRNWFDYLIVAQLVRQGTVTPTHYVVTYDDCEIQPDHMQRLTFSFCHMYFNWSGTVRVPAPCLYAHKLAFFVGKYMQKKEAHDRLKEQLYYL